MPNYSELVTRLQQLKLSGAAETLEMRIMEAEQNQLSYSELLMMILSDELQVRRNRTLQRLIANAKLEANKILETFDLTFNPSINAA